MNNSFYAKVSDEFFNECQGELLLGGYNLDAVVDVMASEFGSGDEAYAVFGATRFGLSPDQKASVIAKALALATREAYALMEENHARRFVATGMEFAPIAY